MPENAISAMIAFVGVLLSVMGSFLVSIRQSRIELRKLRSEYSHRYAGKIFEKRIDIYPKLAIYLIDIVQKINIGTYPVDDLKNLPEVVLDWNKHNSLFLSSKSGQIMHEFYIEFSKLSKMPDGELRRLVEDNESLYSLKNLKKEILGFLLSLQNDLGIHSLEPVSAITGTTDPKTHKDVAKLARIES